MIQQTRLRQELKKQRQRDSLIRKVILIVIVVIAAVYAAGFLFYNSHFYVGGSVFGISLRNQTVESLKEQIREKISSYQLTVVTRDGEELIGADGIGLDYDDQGEIEALLEEQNAALWFLMFAADVGDYEVDVTLDEGMLGDAVSALSCMQEENMTEPADAYLDYEEGTFLIREETYGNHLEYETVFPVIRDAVCAGMSEIVLEEYSCYTEPGITQDDEALVEECEQLNSLLGVEITYDFSDRTMVVDGSVISDWIVLGDDYTWELDEDAAADYVYEMAYETDTFGLSRTFTTHDGSVISLKGGDYGWCINQTGTTEQLIGLIEAGESVTVEPVYRYSGVCRDTNDIGDNYVEISISEQTMWVYSGGECVVSTSVVTGNSSRGYDTPSGGVWAVDARITDYTLTGQDYNTEVSYWLPFNGNVGIHDATWRSSFGGDIYKTNGSHGCVNTPLAAMKIVYENVQIGYPVVVY